MLSPVKTSGRKPTAAQKITLDDRPRAHRDTDDGPAPASSLWQRVPLTDLPSGGIEGGRVRITIAPGETWCADCGEVSRNGECNRCGSHSTIAVTDVLHPGEYTVAG